jgi:hypothetical protein
MTWRQLAKGAEAMARLQPLPQPHLIQVSLQVSAFVGLCCHLLMWCAAAVKRLCCRQGRGSHGPGWSMQKQVLGNSAAVVQWGLYGLTPLCHRQQPAFYAGRLHLSDQCTVLLCVDVVVCSITVKLPAAG